MLKLDCTAPIKQDFLSKKTDHPTDLTSFLSENTLYTPNNCTVSNVTTVLYCTNKAGLELCRKQLSQSTCFSISCPDASEANKANTQGRRQESKQQDDKGPFKLLPNAAAPQARLFSFSKCGVHVVLYKWTPTLKLTSQLFNATFILVARFVTLGFFQVTETKCRHHSCKWRHTVE